MPSTSTNPKYYQSNILPRVLDLNDQVKVDLLSDIYVELLENITRYIDHVVRENDSLTTICYYYYDTTSLYHLVLSYNGLVWWSQVQPGDIIRIPDKNQINYILGRNRQQVLSSITI